MVEAIGLLVLGVVPAVPSNFKVRGHNRVTLGHDVGAERNAPRGRSGRVWRSGFCLGWGRKGCQEITGEWLVQLLNSIIVRFLDSLFVSCGGEGSVRFSL